MIDRILAAFEVFLNKAKSSEALTDFNLIYVVNPQEDLSKIKLPYLELLQTLKSLEAGYDVLQHECQVTNKEVKQETCTVQKVPSIEPYVNRSKHVQICVDHNEMNRRISAFVSRKRKEMDDFNTKEFCHQVSLDEENPILDEMNSCARVDAIFIPKCGSKGTVKVSKVLNSYGPQTQQPVSTSKNAPTHSTSASSSSYIEDVEERLRNMESHLKLKSENSFRRSLYSRLKAVEDRILYLEGISPDYFHSHSISQSSPVKQSVAESAYMGYSTDELKKRMKVLKEELVYKSKIMINENLVENHE